MQIVYNLYDEYQVAKNRFNNDNQQAELNVDIEYHITKDADVAELDFVSDFVIEAVPEKDYKEISPDDSSDDDSSNDDDFEFLSPNEEHILVEAKADLVRYRKKIAEQRIENLTKSKREKVIPRRGKHRAITRKKAIVIQQKRDELKERIPTMAHVRRNNAKNAFFDWPIDLNQFWLSSVYGMRKHPRGGKRFHYGIDLAAVRGTPVAASAEGVIVQAEYVSGYGNNIIVQHNHKYKTRYAHLHKIYVKKGQTVKQGQTIGTVGATGYVRKSGRDASHLHFEIYVDGQHVNPLKYLLNE